MAPILTALTALEALNEAETGGFQLTVSAGPGLAASGGPRGLDGIVRTDRFEQGGPGDDSMTGGADNDTLFGGAGNDTISGGEGDDYLVGDADHDSLDGGLGDDTLYGSEGNDSLTGGDGQDSLAGEAGNDQLRADAGNDTVVGGDGNDYITGGSGNDSLDGGNGGDTADYYYSDTASGITVNLATGVVTGGAGNDTLVGIEYVNGSDFDDSITGSAGYNFLEGRGGNDTLRGGDTNDDLRGGAGNDLIDGQGNTAGADFDIALYSEASSAVQVNLQTGEVTGGAGNDTLVGIEGVDGSIHDDSITGSDAVDLLRGRSGDDTIDGGLGFDLVNYGEAGSGVVVNLEEGTATGGAGNDTLISIEHVLGSSHADHLIGDEFGNFLRGRGGNDTIDGGEGSDRAAYDFGSGAVNVSLVSNTSTGAEGNDVLIDIENLRGGSFNDTLTGDDFINNIEGRDGNDLISGGAGRDSLFGEGGSDTLDGGEVLDRINYLDGNFASWGGATSGVNLNTQTGVVQDGRGGIDQISNITFFFVSDQADTITGSTALIFEQFEGGLGNDTIDGGLITDTLNFDNSNRVSYQSATAAVTVDLALGTATGGAGNDLFSHINQIRGSSFDDLLTGSDEDVITESFEGRAGDDTIDGAGGNDQVRYENAAAGVAVNLADGTAEDGDGGTDTLLNIEGVRGSSWNDTLIGGNTANGTGERDGLESFEGREGNDRIDGGGGYDRADYQNTLAAVNVTLGGAANGKASDGYGGTDTLIDIEGVRGSAYNDTLKGSNDAGQFESFEGREGNDTIDGNGGTDRVDYSSSRAAVTVSLADGTASDGYGDTDTLRDIEDVLGSRDFNDSLTGSSSANLLEGQGGRDTLVGNGGHDTLDGGSGNDSMKGGNGNDSYLVGSTGDRVVEVAGGGIDQVTTSLSLTLPDEVENLVITGSANRSGTGNDLANQLTGNSGNNLLTGGAGADTIQGGGGNDTLDGGGSGDSLTGGSGNDSYLVNASGDRVVEAAGGGIDTVSASIDFTLGDGLEHLLLTGSNDLNGSGNGAANRLTGNSGKNALLGGDDKDTLEGGGGDDQLQGGAGADSLVGGAGNDALTGGGSADRFVLSSLTGPDTVSDFVSGTDQIVISQAGIAVGNGNTTISGAVKLAGPGGFANTAELVIISANIGGDDPGRITKSSAAAQIGSATSAYAVGRDVLFAVDNGNGSALYLFTSADGNAQVSASELMLLATLTGAASTRIADFIFGD